MIPIIHDMLLECSYLILLYLCAVPVLPLQGWFGDWFWTPAATTKRAPPAQSVGSTEPFPQDHRGSFRMQTQSHSFQLSPYGPYGPQAALDHTSRGCDYTPARSPLWHSTIAQHTTLCTYIHTKLITHAKRNTYIHIRIYTCTLRDPCVVYFRRVCAQCVRMTSVSLFSSHFSGGQSSDLADAITSLASLDSLTSAPFGAVGCLPSAAPEVGPSTSRG